jgi:hypothetical protein
MKAEAQAWKHRGAIFLEQPGIREPGEQNYDDETTNDDESGPSSHCNSVLSHRTLSLEWIKVPGHWLEGCQKPNFDGTNPSALLCSLKKQKTFLPRMGLVKRLFLIYRK